MFIVADLVSLMILGSLSPYDHSCWWDVKHKRKLY